MTVKRAKVKSGKEMENGLNFEQEQFCILYATDKEFFGNGAAAYMEVYKIDKSKPNWYRSACSAASRLLSNVRVIARINELLESDGLNNEFVDKQTLFLITQHADFTNKLGAIREFNRLKRRIEEKSAVTVNVVSVERAEEIKKALEDL